MVCAYCVVALQHVQTCPHACCLHPWHLRTSAALQQNRMPQNGANFTMSVLGKTLPSHILVLHEILCNVSLLV